MGGFALLAVVALLIVSSSVGPAWAGALAPASIAVPSAPAPSHEFDTSGMDSDGGACGDEEEQPEELVHCGADISVFDRPGLLGVLRESIERMTPGQCRKLLDDLYDRETCRVGGRECGDLLPLGLPPVGPKSMSSSSSGAQSWLERIAVVPAGSKVAGPRASSDPMPRPRAIAPPDRPPRSLTPG